MDNDRLALSPIGQLLPIRDTDAHFGPYACFAYLPADLPEDVDLKMATHKSVAQATGALHRLDQACSQLGDPGLLIRPALMREALDTSALEGTYGQLSDVLEAELSGSRLTRETSEILGYVDAAEGAFAAVQERGIGVGLLAEAQALMFKHVDKPPADVGRVRRSQVWIGQRDTPIDDARFVPPPPDDRLQAALDAWVAWVREETDWPVVLRVALAHYQFETLHPFSDGNGRIGRLAIILQLLRSGIIKRPAVTISPWFLKRRDEYQNQLLAVSVTGDWNPWVQFFCRALSDQCAALIAGADRLTAWLDDNRRRINQRRWAGTIHDVLNDLTKWPIVTVASVSQKYGVTTTAATNILNHLIEEGVLRELTGRSYGRTFGASEVMHIVEVI